MAIATVSPVVSDREWNAHILAQLAAGKITQEAALGQIKTRRVFGQLTELQGFREGCVSVYGLQHARHALRRAVERLLDFADHIREFIGKCNGSLARKQRS